jgi:hypothetical protein
MTRPTLVVAGFGATLTSRRQEDLKIRPRFDSHS